MNKLIFRLFLIIIFWGLLFVYIFPWSSYNMNVPFSGKDYKLGLDLRGWIELDYKVDLEEAKKAEDYTPKKEKDIIEGLKSIIDKRIETLNINDSVITSASYAWEQHIIVQIPMKWNDSLQNNENIKRAKEAIGKVVKIVFKEARLKITREDIEARKYLSNKALKESKENKYWFEVISKKYKDTYENIKVWTMSWTLKDFNKYFTGVTDFSTWLVNRVISWNWKEGFDYIDGKVAIKQGEKWYYILNVIWKNKDKYDISYIFISEKPSNWKPAKDKEGRILNDKYFVKSSVQYDDAFNPMIELTFNSEWANIFGELTKRLVWKQIAIFVWWENLTSPTVQQPILSWRAVVTWRYTPEEAKNLAQNINTWVVPAPIYLTSEKTIDSKLWASSLEKLIVAWVAWFWMIFIFLIFTYRLSGLIASISLFIYVMIVLTVVKIFWVVLTLASIAWLILSIGMAIDANILIFERIREELKQWKKIEQASIIWFKKSWSAIWDSNVTGFIVALILFVFWINLIKWFGLMLAIWIVVSLFSVFWISRILVLLSSKTTKSNSVFIGK